MSSIKAAVYESELFGAAAPDVRKTASNVGALNELFHEMHGAQVPLDGRGVVLWRDHKVAGHPRNLIGAGTLLGCTLTRRHEVAPLIV